MLASRHAGVLATLERDGRPQLSTLVHAWDDQQQLARTSVTADRAKTRDLPADPGRPCT